MAVSRKSSSGGRSRRRAGGFFGAGSRVLLWVTRILVLLFIVLCLVGVINQARTGQSIFNFYKNVGAAVGQQIMWVFTGEETLPVEITDQGVYLDGYSPDDAEDISDVIGDLEGITDTESSSEE